MFMEFIYLHIGKRRYVCRECGKRFCESNSFLPRYHRATNRLVVKVICDFRSLRSAKDIGQANNISGQTALRYFGLVNYSCTRLPEILSIDEFKGNAGGEKYQTIITDAKNKKKIDVLPNRKKSDLIRHFRNFENIKDVKYVVIDMNRNFKDVAETCFPKATIVIDRYHVTRQAIWALENVRKVEQRSLPKHGVGFSSILNDFCTSNRISSRKMKNSSFEEFWASLHGLRLPMIKKTIFSNSCILRIRQQRRSG